MRMHYSDQQLQDHYFADFDHCAMAPARTGQTPRRILTTWLAVAVAAYTTGARLLGATLCAEHTCDVSDQGEDWLRVRSDRAADYAGARQCHECSQVFAPVLR